MKLKLVQFSTRNFVPIYILGWIFWHLSLPLVMVLNRGRLSGKLRLSNKSLFIDVGRPRSAAPTILPCLTLDSAHSYIATAPRAREYFSSSAGLAQLVERLIRN